MRKPSQILSIMLFICLTAAFASDQWVTTGRDIEYPNELYFVGVGMSERGPEAAKQNAMVEVKKQITVKISASTLDEQFSLTTGNQEVSANRIESRSRLVTSGDVQGIEVVKTATQGNITYALAVLDKKNFTSNCRAKIVELKKQLEKLMTDANADIGSAKIGAALDKLSEAKKTVMEIGDERTLLSSAGEITAAEGLNYTMTDIAALYEKCVSSIRMAKISGDNQTFAVGMVPSDPFVVMVSTADGAPVPMLPVAVFEGNKKVLEKFTDDKGKAALMLGEKADMSVGAHSYTAGISLQVSSAAKKYLSAQDQTFGYTVQSNPCFANVQVDVSQTLFRDRDEITKKVIARLAKYDLKNDPQAENTLKVMVSAVEAGGVEGLSQSSSFIKTEVTLSITLIDEDKKEAASIQASAKGIGGSVAKSAVQGIDNVKIDKDLKPLLEKICGAKTSGPKLKIAVFEFKNRGYYASWWDMALNLSDMLVTKVINSGKFDVVERSQLDKIMEEKSLAQSGVVEESEALKVAKLAGADLILIGTANIGGGKIEADARIVDIKTGVAKCAMSSSAYSMSELRALADDLGAQIKGKCAK
jgi:TolB-like protein